MRDQSISMASCAKQCQASSPQTSAFLAGWDKTTVIKIPCQHEDPPSVCFSTQLYVDCMPSLNTTQTPSSSIKRENLAPGMLDLPVGRLPDQLCSLATVVKPSMSPSMCSHALRAPNPMPASVQAFQDVADHHLQRLLGLRLGQAHQRLESLQPGGSY
jgi:hypothetical protein